MDRMPDPDDVRAPAFVKEDSQNRGIELSTPDIARPTKVELVTEAKGDYCIKRMGNRRIMIQLSDVLLFDTVFEERNDLSYKEALKKHGRKEKGDAIVKAVYTAPFYDFILKFPIEKDNEESRKKENWREKFEQLMIGQGLILEFEENISGEACYIKVISPFERLCIEAEKNRINFPIKSEEKNEEKTSIFPEIPILNHIFHDHERPMCMCFRRDKLSRFVKGDYEEDGIDVVVDSFFATRYRVSLTHSIISSIKLKPYKKKHTAVIRHLLRDGVFSEFFPLHDGPFNSSEMNQNERAKLVRNWAEKYFSPQPYHDIRNYLGEKFAFYFSWLGFYTNFLFVAGVVGLLVFFYGIGESQSKNHGFSMSTVFDNSLSPFYALFISIWSTLFLEFWKRRNNILAYRWSVLNCEREEVTRPEWESKFARISPVTGKYERYTPFLLEKSKLFVSTLVVIISVLVVLLSVGLILVYKVAANSIFSQNRWAATLTSGILSLVLILLLDYAYSIIVLKLTKWENHKTDTSFENSIILKRFVFDFVNNYATLFYIGLIKQPLGKSLLGNPNWNDTCDYESCFVDLIYQLLIIFLGKQLIGQVQEELIPYLISRYNEAAERKARLNAVSSFPNENDESRANLSGSPDPNDIPEWVKDDALNKDQGLNGEYNEMVLQFGYMMLFITAFPLAPILAWLNNIYEIRLDASKFLKTFQRTVPVRAQGIGPWYLILTVVSYFSVISNAALIAFGSNYFEKVWLEGNGIITDQQKLIARIVFVAVFEHIVFGVKAVLAFVIPDTPSVVSNAIAKEIYYGKITIEDEPPAEDEDEALEILGLKPSDLISEKVSRLEN